LNDERPRAVRGDCYGDFDHHSVLRVCRDACRHINDETRRHRHPSSVPVPDACPDGPTTV
jgi:hypothetical protein